MPLTPISCVLNTFLPNGGSKRSGCFACFAHNIEVAREFVIFSRERPTLLAAVSVGRSVSPSVRRSSNFAKRCDETRPKKLDRKKIDRLRYRFYFGLSY